MGKRILWAVVILGTIFQIGHFFEHTIQAAVWVTGSGQEPWMSPLAMWLTMHLGPNMKVGMEVLHLLGNLIFLATIGAYWLLFPLPLVGWAFLVELFHLYEHLMLTVSVIALGRPVGLSTLFGAVCWLTPEHAVGYRVLWHFGMNLIPSALLMIGLLEFRTQRERVWQLKVYG